MEVQDKTLSLARDVWVQHGGVDMAEQGGKVAFTGRDDESYVKVLNHFGRVLKLYTFEGGRWVDADTGGAAQPFDESQAGRLPGAVPAAQGTGQGRAAAKGPSGTSTGRGTTPKGEAAGKGKAAGKSKKDGATSKAAGKTTKDGATSKAAGKPAKGGTTGKGAGKGRSRGTGQTARRG